jgi:hypothetical protein
MKAMNEATQLSLANMTQLWKILMADMASMDPLARGVARDVPRAHRQRGHGDASCSGVHGSIGTIDTPAHAGVHADINIDENGCTGSHSSTGVH